MLTSTVLSRNGQRKPYRKVTKGSSALERDFMRITETLTSIWQTPAVDHYLDGLLLDDRGDRMGFPIEVLDELIFLASIRWHQTHQCGTLIDTTSAEAFSYSGNSSDLCSSNSNAWVLL